MNLNWKKILIILAFIISVFVLGYLLYYFFLKPSIPVPSTNININGGGLQPSGTNVNIPISGNAGVLPSGNTNSNIPGRPGPAEPGSETPSSVANGGLTEIKPLTINASYGAALSSDGSGIQYYDKTRGQFYRLTSDGQQTLMSEKIFHEVEKITWAPGKDEAILEYPDGSNILYNFSGQTQVTLPQHWKDFSFSPQGDRIVFKSIGTDAENNWLAVSKADGSEAQKIEPLGNSDASVYDAWSPNQQIIAMYTKGKNYDQQDLFFLGLNNENFKSVTVNGRNFIGQWSTNGDRLLYSAYSSTNDYKPMLWIVSASGENIGQNRHSLGLQTWADKCTFSGNDKVYCAVPKNLQEGAGIFPKEMDSSPCDIYQIDLTTGSTSMVAIPAGDHNINNIAVSQDDRYLYFTSKDDGKLYQIKLK